MAKGEWDMTSTSGLASGVQWIFNKGGPDMRLMLVVRGNAERETGDVCLVLADGIHEKDAEGIMLAALEEAVGHLSAKRAERREKEALRAIRRGVNPA